MAINEPRRHGLTAKQKHEATRAIYGLGEIMANTATKPTITQEDVDRARALIAEYEPKQATVQDINNPPKEPYVFTKFPTTAYKVKEKKDDKAPLEYESVVVQNAEELKKLEGKGYKNEVPAPPPEDADSFRMPAEKPAEHDKAPAKK
jgi:hypothetical protein